MNIATALEPTKECARMVSLARSQVAPFRHPERRLPAASAHNDERQLWLTTEQKRNQKLTILISILTILI